MAILAATLGVVGCLAALAEQKSSPWMTRAAKLPDQALRSNVARSVVESLTTEVGSRPTGTAADRSAGDARYYFDIHHTANDTLKQIDPAKLSQSTAVDAVAA